MIIATYRENRVRCADVAEVGRSRSVAGLSTTHPRAGVTTPEAAAPTDRAAEDQAAGDAADAVGRAAATSAPRCCSCCTSSRCTATS